MPQPLSSLGERVTEIHLSNSMDSPARQRPQLALLAMNVIAEYSILETFFMNVFIEMLGANPEPAAAIYAALNSDKARKDAIRAVSGVVLTDSQSDLLEVLFVLLDRCAKDRNKIAHWTWGHSPQLPDAVLLVDPENHAQNKLRWDRETSDFRRKSLAASLMNESRNHPVPSPSRDGIYVFTDKDFLEASARIQKLIGSVTKFNFIIDRNFPGNRGDELEKKLSDEPEVREALAHRLERRRKFQEAPQPQNEKPFHG